MESNLRSMESDLRAMEGHLRAMEGDLRAMEDGLRMMPGGSERFGDVESRPEKLRTTSLGMPTAASESPRAPHPESPPAIWNRSEAEIAELIAIPT